MDHILYQILKFILNIYKKEYGKKTVNHSIRIYISKTENSIMFKIKTGYYLEHLTPETMKPPGRTKSKIIKNEYGKNDWSSNNALQYCR